MQWVSNQYSHQSVDVFRFLHTKSIQSSQRSHRKHIVYHFVYFFSISNLLLEISINYRFNDVDIKYLSLVTIIVKVQISLFISKIWTKSIAILTECSKSEHFSRFFQFVSMFMISDISKWRITSSNCKYLSAFLAIRFRIEIRERFHLF